jgi:Glyoxalase-like domain
MRQEGDAAMTSVLGVTFDCADVPAVAQFWRGTLGGRVGPDPPQDTAVLEVGADAGPLRLTFRKVPEGKFVKNRVHLDLVTDDFDLDGARLLSRGAVRLRDVALPGARWTTFADVEGNEFDLIDAQVRNRQ